jgi:membrane associated rhomboid family serine protease
MLAKADRAAYLPAARSGRPVRQTSEPILNVPPVVNGAIAVLVLIHAARVWLLSPDAENEFFLLFSFIPARYDTAFVLPGGFPGGVGADVWTFVTYALIHADVWHLGLNAVWLLPFGAALARRFGAGRFLLFLAVTAGAGAGAHLAMHFGVRYPMIGASAAISATMAAAMRFAFQHGGPLRTWQSRDEAAYRVPALPLLDALRDPRFLAFVAVWFGINAIFGLGGLQLDDGQSVAWEAHIGGFVAGALLFSLFDPVPRTSYPDTRF